MKPVATEATVQGDLGGVKIDMSIDASAVEHIMSVLTDLYSDPEMAVIREYSTNAWDSHLLAGVNRPIEVTLPNQMTPYLVIRDFGVGLSVDELTDMYSKYGASTKRDSDDFNGTLGLGAKSALTYTNQFNIVSVKGGVKITVLVSRNERNVGVMEVVDTTTTTDPSGVTITIPTKDHNSVNRKAMRFFSYWDSGTVLIDGEPGPDHPGQKITDTIYIDNTSVQDYVVMGNVCYPTTLSYARNSYPGRRFGVTVHVPIGSVAFTPSRESLQNNQFTKDKIAELGSSVGPVIENFWKSKIENSSTPGEALLAMYEAKHLFGHMIAASFNGKQIETKWDFGRGYFFHGTRTRYATNRIYGSHAIDFENLRNYIIVTEYPSNVDGVSSGHRQKLRWWAEMNHPGKNTFLLQEDATVPGSPWTDSVVRVSWNVVKQTKNPDPVARVRRERTERYDAISESGFLFEVSDFDHDKILYYSSAEERWEISRWDRRSRNTSYRTGDLRMIFPDHHIVCISKNRWDKFKRDWPTAIHVGEAAKAAAKSVGSRVTESDRLWLAVDEAHRRHDLARLYPMVDSILDPDVVSWVRLSKAPEPQNIKEFRKNIKSLHHNFGLSSEAVERPSIDFDERYPLVNVSHLAESVEYMNMIWSKNND